MVDRRHGRRWLLSEAVANGGGPAVDPAAAFLGRQRKSHYHERHAQQEEYQPGVVPMDQNDMWRLGRWSRFVYRHLNGVVRRAVHLDLLAEDLGGHGPGVVVQHGGVGDGNAAETSAQVVVAGVARRQSLGVEPRSVDADKTAVLQSAFIVDSALYDQLLWAYKKLLYRNLRLNINTKGSPLLFSSRVSESDMTAPGSRVSFLEVPEPDAALSRVEARAYVFHYVGLCTGRNAEDSSIACPEVAVPDYGLD